MQPAGHFNSTELILGLNLPRRRHCPQLINSGGATISYQAAATPISDTAARKALFASAIGTAMDGFDLIMPDMLGVTSADRHLAPPQAGS